MEQTNTRTPEPTNKLSPTAATRIPWHALDWILLILAVSGYLAVSAYVAWRNTAVDYPIYYMAAYALRHGSDVYTWAEPQFTALAQQLGILRFAPPYPYPPLTALVVLPLLRLPYQTGLGIWIIVNSTAMILSGLLLGKWASTLWRRRLVWLAVWGMVPAMMSLYAGQVNPITLLAATLACLAVKGSKPWLGGAWLGVGLMFKPLAIGIAAYAIWRGHWRILIGSMVSIAVVLTVCYGFFGANALHFVNIKSTWGAVTYPPAQHLPSLAMRWFSLHEWGRPLLNAPQFGYWLGIGLSAVLSLATMALCLPAGRRGWNDSQLGLIITAILLVNVRTWYHHAVLLAIPIAFLICANIMRSKWWWLLLAVGYSLIAVLGLGWHRLVGHTWLLDLATWGMLLLWGLCAWEICHYPTASKVSVPVPSR
ncbi:MAG: glycosyltransferase family 87 protein [Anaerolineae bacterium]